MLCYRHGNASQWRGLPKNKRFSYDGVLKDLFETDHPSPLEQLTGGLRVREFLNVEFKHIVERRVDLLALLEDDSVFHFKGETASTSPIGRQFSGSSFRKNTSARPDKLFCMWARRRCG
jgi:hypothetical protein